jgi:hypothetical protein
MATKRLSQAERDALRKEREERKALQKADRERKAWFKKQLTIAKANLKKAKATLKALERRKVIAAQIPQLEFDIGTARINIASFEEEIATIVLHIEREGIAYEELQALREEVGIPNTVSSAEENAIVEAVTAYRRLLKEGNLGRIKGGKLEAMKPKQYETFQTDFDLDTSPRGAVATTHTDTKGMILTRENVQEIMYHARKSIAIAASWNLPVYAVVHMYQTEPTYGDKGVGRAGGKPDGWIWQNPEDKKQTLFSTWQGIKAASDAEILAERLEDHLYEMAKANGDKVVAIVHDIEIRSVLPEELKGKGGQNGPTE